MTSQTLISNPLSELTVSQAVSRLPQSDNAKNQIGFSVSSERKLPYQKPQQIELLHLQAEAEALLQQIEAVKQQRLVAANH